MSSRRLILALCVAAVVGAAGGAADAEPVTGNTDTTTTAVNEPVRAVVVRADSGSIDVQNGQPTQVTAQRQWRLVAPTVTQTVSDGVLTVTARCPTLTQPPVSLPVPLNDCVVNLTITVPALVTVQADTGAGDVRTSGLSGDEQLRTAAGNISARRLAAGALTARSAAGSVSISGVISKTVAETSSGNVTVDLAEAPASLQMLASAGDISGLVPAGTYAVSASTDAGNVAVRGITRDPDASHVIRAHTSSGNVELVGR